MSEDGKDFIDIMLEGVLGLRKEFADASQEFENGYERGPDEFAAGLAQLADGCKRSPIFCAVMLRVMEAGFRSLESKEACQELKSYCTKIIEAYSGTRFEGGRLRR